MSTDDHREPYEPRGSRTDLGARGGEIPLRDSTYRHRYDWPPRRRRGSRRRYSRPRWRPARRRSHSRSLPLAAPPLSPIVPIPATNWRRLSPNSAAGRSRSSNETLPASSCFPAGGWSNALSLGSIATAAWPKTLRLRSPVPRLGSTSLASNSSLGDWRVAKPPIRLRFGHLIHTLRTAVARRTF